MPYIASTRSTTGPSGGVAAATIRHMLVRLVFASVLSCAMLGGAGAAGINVAVSATPLSVPFYVAEKQGYFRDEGLDVVIVDCPNGNVCMKHLLEGRAQLATSSDQPIMFQSFEQNTFNVLATFALSRQHVKFIVRKSAGIKSYKDLKGKNIALVRGGAGQYVFDLALLAEGLDPRSAVILDLDLKQLDKAAANKQIDGFAVWQPGASQLLKALGNDGLMLPKLNLYTLTFNLSALRDAPGIQQGDHVKFLRALDRAIVHIKAQPVQAKALLQDRLKLDSAELELMWRDFRFDLSLNQSLIATLESSARWAQREGLIKHKTMPNYLDFIDVEPLKRVQPAAVTLAK